MSLPANLVDRLVARIKINLGRGTADTTLNDYVLEWVNLTQRKICRDHNLWFMMASTDYSFVAGESVKTLPTDFKDEDSVWIKNTATEYTELDPMDETDMYRTYDDTTQEEPTNWLVTDTQLVVRPVADAAYTIVFKYWKYLTDLEAAGATNSLLTNFSDLLEAGATARGFRYLQLYDDATPWETLYRELEKDLLAHNNERVLPDEMVIWARPDVHGTTIGTIKNR